MVKFFIIILRLHTFFFFYPFWVKRFDGLDLLRKWKGKKIMFVGDSLSLNQWQSLICLIHASVPNSKANVVRKTPLSYVTFQVSCRTCLFLFLCFWKKSQVISMSLSEHVWITCLFHFCNPFWYIIIPNK